MTTEIIYDRGPLDGVKMSLPPKVDSVYLVCNGKYEYNKSAIYLAPPNGSDSVWYARSIMKPTQFDFVAYMKAKEQKNV